MADTTTPVLDLYAPGALGELFARNRALYGDSTMEAGDGDSNDGESGGSGDAGTTPPEGTPAPTGKVFSEDYVKSLRQEAAGHRTAKVAAEQARDAAIAERDAARNELTAATTTSATADDRVTAAEATATKYRVALEKGLPLALAERLMGSTPEELATDADVLLAMRPGSTRHMDQGNHPAPPAGNSVNDAFRALAGF